jgi:hypothetical protein
MGCDVKSFRFDSGISDYPVYDALGEEIETLYTTLYPPFIWGHKDLEEVYLLPSSIQKIYNESVNALKAKCNILAGAGFRAVIEAICQDKNILGGNLEQKINNLQKDGLITKNECSRLHSIRFLGNDSIHEMIEPNDGQLEAVLKITEHLLNNIYIIDPSAGFYLDTPINDFNSFTRLIEQKMVVFKIGEEVPLIQIFGKDIRRVRSHFLTFEKELISKIDNQEYEFLSKGAFKQYRINSKSIQHFIIAKMPEPNGV